MAVEQTLVLLKPDAMRRRLIERGSQQVAKFSWRTAAQQVIQLYRNIGSKRTRVAASL